MDPEKVIVVIRGSKFPGNVTIVGDWFGAKALPPRDGAEYQQTIFCHHAPKILSWLHDFDSELENTLQEMKTSPEKSRDHAIESLEARLHELPED